MGVLLGTIFSFYPTFRYLGDEHGSTNGMCLLFYTFYVLPRASYVYIHGFIPSVVWEFSNIVQVLLSVGS